MDLTPFIRGVPDFPKPGILFRDITPLLADKAALADAIQQLAAPWRGERLDVIAAIEARGFLFATPLALALGLG
ncbi:MAG: adenine phosphoribosyltransferase, partial [Planctomycetes bacterium]|nr:adenine phosphoribosyltransferase [Planctomycetota bacterium]